MRIRIHANLQLKFSSKKPRPISGRGFLSSLFSNAHAFPLETPFARTNSQASGVQPLAPFPFREHR